MSPIIKWLDDAIEHKWTVEELAEARKPELKKVEERRVKVAVEAIPEIKPPKTPEELERAAEVLKKRAKELKTPEQILEEKREKARSALLTGKGNICSIARQKEKHI
jgi:glycerophosphoryl diester phosphodiesterase